ncbi:MAG: hypothetical protein ACRDNJ_14155 [Solirubrobacteraceae bacterium]
MSTTREQIATAAAQLVGDGHELFVVSNREVLDTLDLAPFGTPVTALDFLAPARAGWSVADLMRAYNVLNATAFGEKGIPLQNWVMIDLGLLPSAFVLVTLSPERAQAALDDAARNGAGRRRQELVLGAVLAEARRLDYTGPLPVAGYCAAPTPSTGSWVGWSLCSAIPGLATTVKGLALEIYGARTLTGVAQFSDLGLRVHRKFGRMEILRAVLDLHPVPHTMVYRTEVFQNGDDHVPPSFWLDCDDLDGQRRMQAALDAGSARFQILSPGLVDDRVPILECR